MKSTHAPLRSEARLNIYAFGPDAMNAMAALDRRIELSDLERKLIELVRLRVSQINRCAYCTDKHAVDARKAGASEREIALVSVWRDAAAFTSRERAALTWAEALTLVNEAHVSNAIWEEVKDVFIPSQLVDLTLVVNAINSWNRFAIGFRRLPA